MLNKFKEIFKSTHNNDKIIALFIRGAGIPLAFFLSIFLTRVLDIEVYGSYLSITQLLFFIVNLSLFGIGPIVIKKVSVLYNENEIKKINTFLLEILSLTIVFFLIISVLLILFKNQIVLIYDLKVEKLELFLLYFIAGSLLQLVIWVLNFFFISFKKIWESNLNERFLLNGTFFLLTIIFSVYNLNIEIIALCFFLSRLISLTICTSLIIKEILPFKFHKVKIKSIRNLIFNSWPVWLSNSTIQLYNVIPLQLIVLLENTKSAALFGVAFSLSTITSFLIKLSYTFVGSDIARAHNKFDSDRIMEINLKYSFGLGLVSFFFFIIFVIFGKIFLNIWGHEYVSAYQVLIILSFGQVVNSFGGVSEMILNICGLQKLALKISLKSLALSLVSCIILTYFYGYFGTAIGYFITLVSYNYLKLKSVKKITYAKS